MSRMLKGSSFISFLWNFYYSSATCISRPASHSQIPSNNIMYRRVKMFLRNHEAHMDPSPAGREYRFHPIKQSLTITITLPWIKYDKNNEIHSAWNLPSYKRRLHKISLSPQSTMLFSFSDHLSFLLRIFRDVQTTRIRRHFLYMSILISNGWSQKNVNCVHVRCSICNQSCIIF
jgi:hypothetical protein